LNYIVINNPAVSAQHAILARVADSYRLKDLNSTYGTQVNGLSITDAGLNEMLCSEIHPISARTASRCQAAFHLSSALPSAATAVLTAFGVSARPKV
jgi:hypothetical protein